MHAPALQAYPGTPQHQALLQVIVAHYHDDPRILAIAVFGSLGRGNWDPYSDLDLDIVVADGVQISVMRELQQLCASFGALGERALIFEPDGEDACDVVFASLMGLSIRYHALATTSPNIVDSLQLLIGRIEAEDIRAAGLANRHPPHWPLVHGLDQYIRLAVNADIALQRQHFWRALQILNLMREMVLQAFALTHGGDRPYHTFQSDASSALQAHVGATLPHYSLRSAQESLAQLLDIVEHDLATFTNGHMQLTDEHRVVIAAVRQRQSSLELSDSVPS